IREILAAGTRIADLHQQHDAVLSADAWGQDLTEIRQALEVYGRKWTRIFSGVYRKAHSKLVDLCHGNLPRELDKQLSLIDTVHKAQNNKMVIRKYETLAASLFGPQWQGEQSDWAQLTKVLEWLCQLHADVDQGTVPKAAFESLSANPDLHGLTSELAAVEQ